MEPNVMPLMKYFWKNGYAMSKGRTAMTAMAIRTLILGIVCVDNMEFM